MGFWERGLQPLSLFIKVITVELLGIPAATSQEAQLPEGREVEVVVGRATERLFKGSTGLSLVSDRAGVELKSGGLKRPSEVLKAPPLGR